MKKKELSKVILVIIMLIVFACQLTACSLPYEGRYDGTFGSYLELRSNGTCIYAEDDMEACKGTWYVKDGVIYIVVEELGYVVYGSTEYSENGILLTSSESNWRDEYFVKNN